MAGARRPPQNPPVSEENLTFEIAEDNKLRAIGIDPDSDPVAIMVELDRRMQAHRRVRKARPQKTRLEAI